jgi:hypothetical protein
LMEGALFSFETDASADHRSLVARLTTHDSRDAWIPILRLHLVACHVLDLRELTTASPKLRWHFELAQLISSSD